jgi:hypothetical protein
MKIGKLLLRGLMTLFVAGSANATVMQIEWSGLIYATSDAVGNVFDNGQGANTGVGLSISGTTSWTDARFHGVHNGMGMFELFLDSPISYHASELDPFVTVYKMGNEIVSTEMNHGSHNTVLMGDKESGARGDSFSLWGYNSGWYQVGPEINGVSDHVYVRTSLFLGIDQPAGGSLINGTSANQPITWPSAMSSDPQTGYVSIHSSYWEGGTERLLTGTQRQTLKQASASFVLTSFKATTVPEPSTLGLLTLGLVGVALVRRQRGPR